MNAEVIVAQPQMPVPISASANALAQREIARIQAQAVIARERPRDEAAAMDKIRIACGRLSLAQTAIYQYSRGGTDIEGPSIRLVEEIVRHWGHILSGVDQSERRGDTTDCRAWAYDAQANNGDEKNFQVKHWRDTKKGGYMVKDERDIYEIVANQGARRKRACLLALIPGDIVDEAVEQCKETLRTKVQITPQRIASLAKKFMEEFGVTHAMLEKRLQRRLDTMTPAQMVQLSRVYTSLTDGMSVAADWFEVEPAAEGAEPVGRGVEGVKATLRKRSGKKDAEPAPVVAATQPEFGIADERALPPEGDQ